MSATGASDILHPRAVARRARLARKLATCGLLALSALACAQADPAAGESAPPAVSSAAPAPLSPELQAKHKRYVNEVLRVLRSCLGDPRPPEEVALDDAWMTPAIRRVCSCYRGLDSPEEPLLHQLRLVVRADGTIKRVSDAASGDRPEFGSCDSASLQGLSMPPPPSATVIELRFADILFRPKRPEEGDAGVEAVTPDR